MHAKFVIVVATLLCMSTFQRGIIKSLKRFSKFRKKLAEQNEKNCAECHANNT